MTLLSSASSVAVAPGRFRPSATVSADLDARRGGRVGYAETIRGLTCFFVVLYHAIGNDPAHGLHAEPGSIPWAIARLLDLIDMPLFAFVSGRVFGIPTGDGGRFVDAFARKVLRLGVPLVSVTTFYLILAHLTGRGSQASAWEAFTQPFEHLWFLQASLWLMAVAAIGSWVFGERRLTFAVLALLVAGITYLLVPMPASNVFSWYNAVILAPYYFLGHLVAVATRQGAAAFEGRGDRFDTALLSAFLAFGLLALWAEETPFEQSAGVFRDQLLIGIAAVTLFAIHAPRLPWMETLARRSYTIYLFHVFLLAPTRMAIVKIWPDAPSALLLVASLSVGIAVPWMLHAFLARHPLTAFLFQGVLPARGRRDEPAGGHA